jgi:hypothetical protein
MKRWTPAMVLTAAVLALIAIIAAIFFIASEGW